MTNQSIKEIIQTKTKQLFISSAIVLAVLTTSASLLFSIRSKQESIKTMFFGIESGLKHNLLVGDRIQITRLLGSMVESGNYLGATLTDTNNETIAGVGAPTSQNKFQVALRQFTMTQNFEIKDESGTPIGQLTVSSELPFSNILTPLIGVIGILFLFGVFFYRAVSGAAIRASKPLHDLSLAIENDLAELKINSSGVVEVEAIKKVLLDFNAKLTKAHEKEKIAASQEALVKLARQVAHDIRSPMMALKLVATPGAMEDKDTQRAIITMAVDRISAIADDLLKNSKTKISDLEGKQKDPITDCSLALQDLLKEKSVEFKRQNIDFQFYTKTQRPVAKIDKQEFLRVISNLINNSVEASKCGSPIFTRVSDFNNFVDIEIEDLGQGINPDVIEALRNDQSPVTTKKDGNGLGLQHAISTIKKWGGEFAINSIPGKGTLVKIQIPSYQ